MTRALLPAGVHDYLPEMARQRCVVANTLLQVFHQHGYDLVLPPLLEFEQSLLPAMGNNLSHNTFRVMDLLSHEMMALRADITPQIARIATTRLEHSPRPLRLCYAGDVLRVSGSALHHERQALQAGIELFGFADVAADAEIIILASKALSAIGIRQISVDLTIPPLLTVLADVFALPMEMRPIIFQALEHKEQEAIALLPAAAQPCFSALLQYVGNVEVLNLGTSIFPAAALPLLQNVQDLIKNLQAVPSIHSITLDMTEQRGFAYHTGVCFSLFADGFRGEVGRGGRYKAGEVQEDAVGFSVYIDPLLPSLPSLPPAEKILVPHHMPLEVQQRLIADGFRLVPHLGRVPLTKEITILQGCSGFYGGDRVQKC